MSTAPTLAERRAARLAWEAKQPPKSELHGLVSFGQKEVLTTDRRGEPERTIIIETLHDRRNGRLKGTIEDGHVHLFAPEPKPKPAIVGHGRLRRWHGRRPAGLVPWR